MGKKSIMSFFKKSQKEEQKDLEKRAEPFQQEYSILRRKYKCDFQSYLKMMEGGKGGIVPGLQIIDVTEKIEAEDKAREKEQQAKEEKEHEE